MYPPRPIWVYVISPFLSQRELCNSTIVCRRWRTCTQDTLDDRREWGDDKVGWERAVASLEVHDVANMYRLPGRLQRLSVRISNDAVDREFVLPLSVKSLNIFNKSMQLTQFKNLDNLREMEFMGCTAAVSDICTLAPRLEKLTVLHIRADTPLPSSLRFLHMGGFIRKTGTPKLPPNLEHLEIMNNHGFPPDIFANCTKLKVLKLDQWYDQPMKDVALPPNLEEFIFIGDKDQVLEDVAWPASLTSLALTYIPSDPSTQIHWPRNLRSLSIYLANDFCIPNLSLPDTLVNLDLGNYFYNSKHSILFPKTLETLKLGYVHLSSVDFILRLENLRLLMVRPQYWDEDKLVYIWPEIQKLNKSLIITDVDVRRTKYLGNICR